VSGDHEKGFNPDVTFGGENAETLADQGLTSFSIQLKFFVFPNFTFSK